MHPRLKVHNITGTVTRINVGWPSVTKQVTIHKRPRPADNDMEHFEAVLKAPFFHKLFWQQLRGFLDVDYETLRRWINQFSINSEHIKPEDMENIVFQYATDGSGFLA